MKILALEFSSPQRSVAVVQSGAAHEAVEAGERAVPAIALIESVLRDARLEREQIECLAVGLGPGSYTGIRAAIALAQGWQLARDLKLLGISTADCVAAQALADGVTGPVAVVIDAQRKEFYLAGYVLDGATCRPTVPLRLASREQVLESEQSGHVLIGPEIAKWFPSGRVVFPRAERLARIALARTDFVPGEKLEPIYLRETTFVKWPDPTTRK